MTRTLAPGALARWMGGVAASSAISNTFAAFKHAPPVDKESEDALDEAIQLDHDHAPYWGGGLPNNATIGAGCLAALGQGKRISRWVGQYNQRLKPLTVDDRAELDMDQLHASLGCPDAYPDWVRFFRGQLDHQPWPKVLNLWIGRLSPGMTASAMTGVTRTAHAVRALNRRVSELRLEELARSLAWWAATYHPLVYQSDDNVQKRSIQQAFLQLPTLKPHIKPKKGSLTTGVMTLEHLQGFGPVIDWIEITNPSEMISEITQSLADIYLEQCKTSPRIVFATAIASTSITRYLTPYLDQKSASQLMRHLWQSVAALVSAYRHPQVSPLEEAAKEIPLQELLKDTDNVHALKLIDACEREHIIKPNPAFQKVASDFCQA